MIRRVLKPGQCHFDYKQHIQKIVHYKRNRNKLMEPDIPNNQPIAKIEEEKVKKNTQ